VIHPLSRPEEHAAGIAAEPAFLTAQWRWLAILNYSADPALLRPYLPPGLELDDEDGRVYLSVVGMLFVDTRVRGLAIPWHRHFPEVNLRFYVRRRAAGGWQRGITFIRELVPLPLVTWVARAVYNEPYRTAPMRAHVPAQGSKPPAHAQYEWRLGGRHHTISVTPRPHGAATMDGTHEGFITNRPWGFTPRRRGGASVYRVHHPPWTIFPAREARLDADAGAVWGGQFASTLAGPPHSAFLAAGSAVTVFKCRRLDTCE
jgi:uncharacterized protein